MKRILITTIIFLFPALLFAQERVEKRIKLKDGTVLTGFVEQQQDGSYLIETDSGDILFFSPSEIANLTTVNEKSKALGDINSTDSIVYLKRGKIFFYANNEEVTQNDFAHIQVWQDYQRAQKIRRTGGTLAII